MTNKHNQTVNNTNTKTRREFTAHDLYTWGFRATLGIIGLTFLFVASIYYGIINP